MNNQNSTSFVKVIAFVGLIAFAIGGLTYVMGWFSEAGEVAKEEFGARASLKKYEWFKTASATIEEKKNSIQMFENNMKSMEEDYGDIHRADWDRLDKQQYNQWKLELYGMKSSYNSTVKEYNAQSSKFNWELYNTDNLPTEYTTYLNN